MKPVIIGVAGTAKNTGKTTNTMAIMDRAFAAGFSVAVTSIGLDGEHQDQITGLPKPKLVAVPGMFVLTAERCLAYGQALIKKIEALDIDTALGPLVLGKVASAGTVFLVGPNRRDNLERAAEHLGRAGVDLFLVDGALNRMVPLTCSDIFILATGAARHVHIPTLVHETEALVGILRIEPAPHRRCEKGSYVEDAQGRKPIPYDSLLSPGMVDEVLDSVTGRLITLSLDGVLTVPAWERLLARLAPRLEATLILANPLNLLAGGEILAVNRNRQEWLRRGGKIEIKYELPLRAVTINSFYPCFHEKGQLYKPSYIDRDELKKAMAVLPVPVIDVVADGAERLWQALFPGSAGPLTPV